MPKNKGKGGKKRRRGRNEKDMVGNELIEKDSDQQAYARVMKLMGGGRLIAHCFDGKERHCNIRGKLRKRMWINQGDIILLGLRDYQDEKADVIHKYTPEQARLLKAKGQLPETVEFRKEHDEGDIVFEDTDLVPQDRNYDIESSSGEDFDSEEDEDEEED